MKTRRIARIDHDCESETSRYCSPIRAGDAYLTVTTFRLGAAPRQVKHCVYCAGVTGDDYLLVPIPATQDYRYWDLDTEKLALDAEAAFTLSR